MPNTQRSDEQTLTKRYRPNPDTQDKTGSVYSQPERHLQHIKDDRNSRRAFIKDLEKSIDQWMEDGNLLIIGLDANDM
jgi:hypothetical protein